MPRKFELTWFAPRKCWKKKRKGQVHYLGQGRCGGKSDLRGYQAALEEWNQLEQKLEREEQGTLVVQARTERNESAQRLRQLHESARDGADELERRGQRMNRDYPIVAMGGDIGLPEDDPEYPTRDNIESTEFGRLGLAAVADMTEEEAEGLETPEISALIGEFVAFHFQRADAKQIAQSTALQYQSSMGAFKAWCEQKKLVTVADLQPKAFAVFQVDMLKQIGNGSKQRTVRDRLLKAKQFAEWLYKHEHFKEMPRTVGSDYASVKQDRPAPKHWEVTELRKVWKLASQELRLYMLLGLNCGYTLADIGTLQHEHVDFEKGIVQRSRHKTSIPQVHKLWPETIELLKKRKTKAADDVLLRSRKGDVLWQDGRTDTYVSILFRDQVIEAGINRDGRSFRHLRSTGANLIEQANPEHPHLSSQYLAHGEGGVKKHYTLPAFKPMFKALDGLREELGLGGAK